MNNTGLFQGSEFMTKDRKIFRFEGQAVDAVWDGRLCIHVGECTRAKGELFVSGREPWCQPDLAAAEDVAAVVERCPSGALYYERKDGGGAEKPDPVNTVVVANNGPLYARGQLKVDGAEDDMPGVAMRVALCRCGGSKRKPFCDNTHESNGFSDRGAVGETGDGGPETGGPLEIKRIPDGPLILSGNLEIRSGAGCATWRGTRAALCRCGASQNKPFCDGSHTAAGFQAD